ncbi:uncharacterized protein FOMMEDRAFT_152016 [Fomitiporia mediterranea MF3/22]|uniref:uncharacterized protein n=1 Tax=Fomitiporia mediterranea (strain MF3/22) TaxID=694068 RepID=UPI0004407978|nr:uncharacterized protein FOMMEDRAFT_152016 [Fomitiporia mediterranea MF3/22]EJD06714.1 hypothetical protein FOMMEDRAFT_152016 [Fomitiporia mediterranea MF3/22]
MMIRLVWPSRWSFIKYVYFLNRTSAFISSFSLVYLLLAISEEESCRPSVIATALMGQLTFVIGEIVLFMRVHAIWCCTRRLLILLLMPGVVGSAYAGLRAASTAIASDDISRAVRLGMPSDLHKHNAMGLLSYSPIP